MTSRNPDKILIGLSGKATAGKDTVADMLLPYFADGIRKCIKVSAGDFIKKELADMTGGSIETIEKNKPVLRWILQKMGEDKIYQHKVFELYDQVLTKCFFVFPSVRYIINHEEIKKRGGLVIRVERYKIMDVKVPSYEDSHVSEQTEAIPFDFSIGNHEGLRQLQREVKWLAQHIKDYYKI